MEPEHSLPLKSSRTNSGIRRLYKTDISRVISVIIIIIIIIIIRELIAREDFIEFSRWESFRPYVHYCLHKSPPLVNSEDFSNISQQAEFLW